METDRAAEKRRRSRQIRRRMILSALTAATMLALTAFVAFFRRRLTTLSEPWDVGISFGFWTLGSAFGLLAVRIRASRDALDIGASVVVVATMFVIVLIWLRAPDLRERGVVHRKQIDRIAVDGIEYAAYSYSTGFAFGSDKTIFRRESRPILGVRSAKIILLVVRHREDSRFHYDASTRKLRFGNLEVARLDPP